MEREPLTTGEIAQYCYMTYRTVLKWIASGKLKAYRTPGNHSRVEVKDFLDFLKQYNMPVPVELRANGIKKRILIVDDDKGMVHAIKRTLATGGKFEIETAYNGFDAGRKLSEFKPDLVLLDIKMPGLDGYEVCSRIRKDTNNKDVKILIISGIIDEEGAKRVMKLGANDYLAKPFDNKELKMKLQNLFGWNGRSEDKNEGKVR